jgi:heptosyltransferase I
MEELRFPAGHVCVVLLSGLGDVVHGLPVVNALKDHDPGRRVTWVVEPMPAPLLRPHPSVDEVVVFEKARGARGVRDLWRALRPKRFDLTLNFNIYFKSVFPTVFSRAPVRIGVDRARARDAVWLFATHTLPPRPRGHTQDLFLEFLEVLGVPRRDPDWRLALTDEERRARDRWRERAEGRSLVAIVPASANPEKDWLPERMAQVVDALHTDFGFRVVLAGGPGARECAVAREVVARSRTPPLWAMADGVRELLVVLAASALVIAPDTGPLHVARALDVPVIGLYGHTNPWRVGPYRKFEDLWVDRYTDPGEPPSPYRIEPRVGRMERITVADVLERVERAVRRYGVGRSLAS